MPHVESSFVGAEGLRLHTQAWLPAGEPVGAVVIAHGLAEHSGRYGELVARLLQRDYAVHSFDLRGHGRSPGPRAYIGRFAYLVADLNTCLDSVAARHPGKPLLLLGHSMGGAIAFACALDRQQDLGGLILSAPALGAEPGVPKIQIAVARLLSRVLPRVGAITLPADAISRDPAVVRDYEQDPLVYRGPVPARTAVELLDAMSRFAARAAELRLPVLILHGTADRLISIAAARPVYERIGSADKTLRLYPGLFHEIFHEPERDAVFADLEAWLDAHRSATRTDGTR